MTRPVRFAIQVSAVADKGASDRQMYKEAIIDAKLTQELGYDAAWMVEHHFSDYHPTPNPLILLSHIAAACPGLGIGTAVMVLPWYDPVRYAEDISMLASLVEGPLYIGMGRGTAKLEYDALRIPMGEARERFKECWEITQLALKGEPFSYTGRYVNIEQPITIRPLLENSRDIQFFGAIGSPASAEIMADLGLTPLTLAQFPDHMLIKILQRWSAKAKANNQPAPATLPISAKCFIGDTDEAAREEARDHLAHFYRLQAEHYTTDTTQWGDIPGYEQFAKIMSNMKQMGDPTQNDPILDRNLVGSPETVARRINELRAIGFDYILVSNATAEVPREARHRMMRRFAEEVIPLVAELPVPEAPVLAARAAT